MFYASFLCVSWLLKYMHMSSCVSKEVKRGCSGSHIGLVYGPMKKLYMLYSQQTKLWQETIKLDKIIGQSYHSQVLFATCLHRLSHHHTFGQGKEHVTTNPSWLQAAFFKLAPHTSTQDNTYASQQRLLHSHGKDKHKPLPLQPNQNWFFPNKTCFYLNGTVSAITISYFNLT